MHMLLRRFGSVFLIALLITVLGTEQLRAQADEPEVRRLSIALTGGVTYGSTGDGMFGPLAGNFNVASFRQPIYGASLQYAFSPAMSMDIGFRMGQFENQFASDPFFETDYQYLSVKAVANMNNIFGFRRGLARVFNPYFSLGLGMMRSEIVTEDLDSQDLALMLTGGAGLSMYLFRGADLFVQYDYHTVGSDLLDGVSGDGGSDQFAAITGGLRLNFGRAGTKLASWPPSRERPVREPVRREVPEPEPEPEPAPEPEPEPVLDDATIEFYTRLAEFLESPYMTRPQFFEDALIRAMERAEQRREEMRRAEEEARRAAERALRDAVEPGHYVQVFSFISSASAENTRDDLIRLLGDDIRNVEDRIIIQRYEDFHRVLIGPFTRLSEASAVLERLNERYDSAFLITFPRRYDDGD
jgi:hypothetical protein